LSLELSEKDRARTEELAAKARAGSLSMEESQEIEDYRKTGRIIELLKIKAKTALPRE
jgi:uncharacterized protein YnzC (UPF0291/DUF896 family)